VLTTAPTSTSAQLTGTLGFSALPQSPCDSQTRPDPYSAPSNEPVQPVDSGPEATLWWADGVTFPDEATLELPEAAPKISPDASKGPASGTRAVPVGTAADLTSIAGP
jgi:hypothetical protein